jgi:hypothetical protein
MKKKLLITCIGLLLIQTVCRAQDTTGVDLDILKAPCSPASNLLGFAVSDVEKPTDVSAFMISLQSSTASYTKLPSNYAVDIAPFLLFRTKTDFTTHGLNSTKFADYFKQTLVISFAISNPDSSTNGFSSNNTYAGVGFKFSLLRPQYSNEDAAVLDRIHSIHSEVNDYLIDEVAKAEQYDTTHANLLLRQQLLFDQERAKLLAINFNDTVKAALAFANELMDSTTQVWAVTNQLQQLVSSYQTNAMANPAFKDAQLRVLDAEVKKFTGTRVGWNWDVAGGISAAFVNRQFDNSRVFNGGLWTTFGYSASDGNSFLFLARWLYNPDRVYALENAQNVMGNISTIDAGARYIYSKPGSKFAASVEAIYRSILTQNTIDPSWRLVLNADYSIGKNQKINFSFGRNFDGTISKGGNLIAALTLLAGFGNKR